MSENVSSGVVPTIQPRFQAYIGITNKNSLLFVTDPGASRISVFDLNGQRLAAIDTSIAKGAMTGILVRDEKIYVLDGKGNRVLRVDFQY